ncbi:hypothetical protein GUITHDRAFT_120999 [Guillardia theta CCMP2712]|uniref:Uncharacterized protein n=1 Tax=Guillardia theta (strain CCMP2712) TaxID=905079 RepID=L1I9Q8_GUITC|nr:hypothetical protein GUITHDRAFT_120999 [Guillardia theta CCMP2712]EKX32807.1 hypothetical protein GUITHDRAFT_120999 [Guillardia theta CCMP2712]|eukprot:XP_005819787.1 hypothetical protein GUITHDRAFT_120999 [Guillardia theta CCMP2712]
MIRAANAHSKHPCSFKIRPQKDKHSGKAGALAEFSHLLKMNGMNSAGITEIYRQHLLQQGIAVLEVQPEAGMQLEVKTKRRNQVLVKSKAQKGRFTREEAEQICDGEDLSMGMTIRGLRRIVASWKESAADQIDRISSKEDAETNSWNGEHLVLSFSESFAPWDRAGKLLLLEPGSANIWEAIATEPPNGAGGDCQPGTECRKSSLQTQARWSHSWPVRQLVNSWK